MVKGNPRISTQEILQATQGGYDILMFYNGNVKRSCKSPFRRESNNSFGFFCKQEIWLWMDKKTEEVGNAIQFVEKKFALSSEKAKAKILYDFGIGGEYINPSPVKIAWEKPEESEYIFMDFTKKPFTKKHHEFWNCAGVSEEWCNKYQCWAVKDAVRSNPNTCRRERIPIKKDEVVFAYWCEEGIKFYFPERDNYRFLTNVPGDFLWNFDNIGHCEKGIGQKSMKDLIVTTLYTPCVFAVQSENIALFWKDGITDTAKRVNEKFDDVYLSYGSDDDGKTKSIAVTKKLGWKWINCPNKYLPETNDFYSLCKNQGNLELEKLLKSKKII
jgi:hypothetical protein